MRRTFTRDFYRNKEYVPIIENDLLQVYKSKDKLIAQAFIGKQAKPYWHYVFNSEDEITKKVSDLETRLKSWEDMKTKRKVERKEGRDKFIQDLKIGDLFYHSWGYDQTNIDFYQVTEINGKTFTMRPIRSKMVDGSTYSHGMADEVVPDKDNFIPDDQCHKTLVKRSLSMEYGGMYKTTENEKHYRSWYA